MCKKPAASLFYCIIQILVFLIIFSGNGFTQSKSCSTSHQAFNAHSQALINFDTSGAVAIAKKYMTETGACKCTGFYLTAWNQMDKRDTLAVTKTLDDYAAYLSKIKADSLLYGAYYTILARNNIFLHTDYPEALAYQLRAISIFENSTDTALYLQNLVWSCVTWYRLNELPNLFKYRSRVKHLLLSMADYPRKAELLTVSSSFFYILHGKEKNDSILLDTALILAKTGLEKARLFHNSVAELDALGSISAIYAKKKDHVSELAYLDSVFYLAQPYKHDKAISGAYQSKSAHFRLKGQFDSAAKYADAAIPYFRRYNSPTLLASGLNTQYKAHKGAGDYKKALSAFEERTQINDSMLTLEKSKKINELEKKYNQAKNEKTILELKQRQQLYLAFAVVVLLAIAVAAFIIREKNLQQKQKILEAEQRLNRARINPHFFFNALASLQQYALIKGEGAKLASSLSKFSHIMRDTLESTYKEYVPLEDEIAFLEHYLSLQEMRLDHRFTYAIETDSGLDISEVVVPPMIIQPFIENAIEHGFQQFDGKCYLSVFFRQQKNNLIITIEDNGTGLQEKSKTAQHISRATQIIKDRLYLLNTSRKTKANFSVKNRQDTHGVQVVINLPLLYRDDVSLISKATA